MYGSIFRMKVKPGRDEQVVDLYREWERDRQPKVKGALGSFLMRTDRDRNTLVGVAVFQDKQAYRANADDPEQDRWYRRLRENLEEDPEWTDGEYIAGG